MPAPKRPRRRGPVPGPSLWSLLATADDRTQTFLRLVLAGVLFPHGAQHLLGWFGGYGFSGTVAWMAGDLGVPAALAALAIVTEFAAPLALVLGVGGRLAGLGLATLMVGAASTHVGNGFFMNWFGALEAGAEGYEYHVVVFALAVAVAVRGSGAWSVDRAVAQAMVRS